MFDPRIYRAALLPALAAFLLLMFSFEPAPNPLQPPIATPAFDGAEAARTAREIVATAPERPPGSPGDRAIADLVRKRFAAIEGGQVSVQSFDADYDGAEVEMQNVIVELPGASDRTLLIVAGRDSARGPGESSTAAATAALIGLADDLGDSRHERTIVLASTDGTSAGSAGARQLLEALPDERIDEAIAISQPGVADPRPPFVIGTGMEPDSPSPELVRTASAIAERHLGATDPAPDGWVGLSRLAFPGGLGEQAVLRDEGLEAIALSAAGERPIPASEDDLGSLSPATLEASGNAVLELTQTLDATERRPEAGPDDYIRVGDNLVPGWTIALLAVTLLIAPLLAAGDTWLRELRVDWRTRRTAFWAAERILLPLAALLLAYVLGLFGLIASPPFPYDPALHEPGARAPVALAALAVAVVLAAMLIRPARTPLDAEPHTLAAAAGLLTGGAVLLIWLLNPYLALLLVPTAHVWLLPARAAGPPRTALIALAALISLMPAVVAFGTFAAQLDLGTAAPWHLLLMIVDGHVGLLTCLLWCAVLGGLIATVNAAAARPSTPAAGKRRSVRGAGTHAGPGALGGTTSALPRR